MKSLQRNYNSAYYHWWRACRYYRRYKEEIKKYDKYMDLYYSFLQGTKKKESKIWQR